LQEQSGHSPFRQVAPLAVLVAAMCCASYWATPLVAESVFKTEHTIDGGALPSPGYDEITDPKTALAFYNKANVHYHIGDTKGTIENCNKSLALDPHNAEALFLRASAYLDDEKNKEGLKDVNKAIQLDPKNAEYYLTRGRCFTIMDNATRAIENYTTAISLDSTNPATYCARAYLLGASKKPQQAIEDLTVAEKLDPRDAWVPFQRGNEKLILGDKQGAIADYNKSLAIDSKYTPVYFNRGRVLCELGDRIQGHKDLDKAIETNAKDAYAYRVRALVLLEEGNTKLSEQDSMKALELEIQDEKDIKAGKKKKKKRYEVIKDPLVYKFCADTIQQEQKIFGAAKVPINRLYICYRTGRSCQTTMVDEKRGIFVICMANDSSVDIYYFSLVHELMHLLNTRLADPFIEGLCTMFVDHTDPPSQRKFKLWSKRYQRGVLRLPFYAETYLMTKDLETELTLEGLSQILRYRAKHTGSKDWEHIDSDAWLASLPEPKRTAARNIIAKYADVIEDHLPDDGAYGFARPSGTKRKDGKVKDQYGKDIKQPGVPETESAKEKIRKLQDQRERNLRWPLDNLRDVAPEKDSDPADKKPSSPKPQVYRQTSLREDFSFVR